MSSKKVYVGSIPGNLSEESVLKHFRQFVPDATFSINKNLSKVTSNSGFGFLTVKSSKAMQIILSRTHVLQGRKLKCQEYLSGQELEAAKENLQRRRLFIRGLKKGTTDQDLFSRFSVFGEVESAYVVKVYSTGETRPFGYVTFKKTEVAESLTGYGVVRLKGALVHIHPFVKIDPSVNAETLLEHQHELGEFSTHQTKFASRSLRAHDPSFRFENPDLLRSKPRIISSTASNSQQEQFLQQAHSRQPTERGQRIDAAADHVHFIKPTSRSFFLSRSGYANHSPSNLVMNVRLTPIGSAKMIITVQA